MLIEKNKPGKITFSYFNADRSPVSGANLSSRVRCDGGPWGQASNAAFEYDPTQAPGVYDLLLNANETNCETVEVYVTLPQTGDLVHYELAEVAHAQDHSFSDEVFSAVFSEPDTAEEQAVQNAFLDKLADAVLRRTQASVEGSVTGDPVSSNSLLGVISLMTQGQAVTGPDCNGQYWIYANSALSGGAPLGAMRVVFDSSGAVVGILPHVGPNSVEQAGGGCFAVGVTASPVTSPGTFLPINGCTS